LKNTFNTSPSKLAILGTLCSLREAGDGYKANHGDTSHDPLLAAPAPEKPLRCAGRFGFQDSAQPVPGNRRLRRQWLSLQQWSSKAKLIPAVEALHRSFAGTPGEWVRMEEDAPRHSWALGSVELGLHHESTFQGSDVVSHYRAMFVAEHYESDFCTVSAAHHPVGGPRGATSRLDRPCRSIWPSSDRSIHVRLSLQRQCRSAVSPRHESTSQR
jgi:hypothetical protein